MEGGLRYGLPLSKDMDDPTSQLQKLIIDRQWRLNNLYQIRDPQGDAIQFKMNPAQRHLYDNMHYFNVILKARQLGFSTFILIYMLDSCLFNENQACGVIAHTRVDAEDLFKNKVRFAYERLPDWLTSEISASSDTARKLEFSNGSSITVGTSLRGGTFQKLHISEYGKIAARYPEKSKEIKTGALNTVHAGQQIFIESTAEGRQGDFFNLCERSRRLRDEGADLSALDPKFHFFAWHNNEKYTLCEHDINNTSLTSKMSDYFSGLGVDLSPGQKAWYIKKESIQGEEIKREFPSTPGEAFEASLEGAYYAKQMESVRRNNQICHIPHESTKRVNTFWDLGQGDDAMSIWFMQDINHQYRFIDYHESSGEGWEYYVNLLASKNYSYGRHYWPHDGNKRIIGSEVKTSKQIAQELGINPIKIVPRTTNVHYDIINKCRPTITRCWFDKSKCDVGITHLDSYRKEWDDKHGVWKDKPRHDESSHGADAFRTFAVGYEGRKQELQGIPESYIMDSQLSDMDYNVWG